MMNNTIRTSSMIPKDINMVEQITLMTQHTKKDTVVSGWSTALGVSVRTCITHVNHSNRADPVCHCSPYAT